MSKKQPRLAICYDFDGTLAPGNMQERNFIPAIGMTKKSFWKDVSDITQKEQADNILVYMRLMLEKAKEKRVKVTKNDFKKFGKELALFDGAKNWFKTINSYAKHGGVKVEHYIISSGLREMIRGTAIAKEFKAIYASSFSYDHHGVAEWPALALNYTTKTQYLFRINKGSLDISDHKTVNKFVPKHERPIPFENMVFIGDGDTDIPCFRLIKEQGGHSVAVYKPSTKGAKSKAKDLMKDGRVNFIAPADYTEKSQLDKIIKGIIDKVAADSYLYSLGKE